MSRPLMQCGHVSQGDVVDAKTGARRPCCVICIGIAPGAETEAEALPSLTGRESVCSMCRTRVPSSYTLAFFEYRPEHADDYHYCGCRGWD